MNRIKPLPGTPLDVGHPMANGLIGCWPLNEGSGIFAADCSLNRNNGTMTAFADPASSTSGWGPGEFGGALLFDGVDDGVTTGLSVGGLSEFSVVTWVTNPVAPTGDTDLVAAGGPPTSAQFELYGKFTGGIYALEFYVYYGGGFTDAHRRSSFITISDGFQHMVVGAFSGSGLQNKLDIYVDAELRNGTLIGTIPSAVNADASTISLGSYAGAAGFMSGQMDSTFIYNRCLAIEEVEELYANPYCMFDDNDLSPMWVSRVAAALPRSPIMVSQAVNRASRY